MHDQEENGEQDRFVNSVSLEEEHSQTCDHLIKLQLISSNTIATNII